MSRYRFLGGGTNKNILKLGCAKDCTTLNTLKTTLLYTFNQSSLWCRNILIKLLKRSRETK